MVNKWPPESTKSAMAPFQDEAETGFMWGCVLSSKCPWIVSGLVPVDS